MSCGSYLSPKIPVKRPAKEIPDEGYRFRSKAHPTVRASMVTSSLDVANTEPGQREEHQDIGEVVLSDTVLYVQVLEVEYDIMDTPMNAVLRMDVSTESPAITRSSPQEVVTFTKKTNQSVCPIRNICSNSLSFS